MNNWKYFKNVGKQFWHFPRHPPTFNVTLKMNEIEIWALVKFEKESRNNFLFIRTRNTDDVYFLDGSVNVFKKMKIWMKSKLNSFNVSMLSFEERKKNYEQTIFARSIYIFIYPTGQQFRQKTTTKWIFALFSHRLFFHYLFTLLSPKSGALQPKDLCSLKLIWSLKHISIITF